MLAFGKSERELAEQVGDFVLIATPHTPETTKKYRRAQQMKRIASLTTLPRHNRGSGRPGGGAVSPGNAGTSGSTPSRRSRCNGSIRCGVCDFIVTPHTTGYSRIAERHMGLLLQNTHRFRSGERLQNVVNKAMWF